MFLKDSYKIFSSYWRFGTIVMEITILQTFCQIYVTVTFKLQTNFLFLAYLDYFFKEERVFCVPHNEPWQIFSLVNIHFVIGSTISFVNIFFVCFPKNMLLNAGWLDLIGLFCGNSKNHIEVLFFDSLLQKTFFPFITDFHQSTANSWQN